MEIGEGGELSPWLSRLLTWGVVRQTGRTKGTRYFVAPEVLRKLEFPIQTSLKRIEPHRLDALVNEDVRRYPGSAISDIRERVAPELNQRQVKESLDRLRKKGDIRAVGEKRGRMYFPSEKRDIDETAPKKRPDANN